MEHDSISDKALERPENGRSTYPAGQRFQIIRYAWKVRDNSRPWVKRTFKLSKDFVLLEVKEVRGDIVLYFGVFTDGEGMVPADLVEPIDVNFTLLTTGTSVAADFPDNNVYAGTVVLNGGSFVGHIWMEWIQR